jgi:hypothetical protein
MAFAPRDRAALDAQRAAEQRDQSLLRMYLAMLAVSVAILFALMLAAAQLAAADEVIEPNPKQNNTCGDPDSWIEWDQIIEKNPHDMDLRALYALRVGLCVQVEQGKLMVDEGTAIFERARQTLIQRAERAAEQAESKL